MKQEIILKLKSERLDRESGSETLRYKEFNKCYLLNNGHNEKFFILNHLDELLKFKISEADYYYFLDKNIIPISMTVKETNLGIKRYATQYRIKMKYSLSLEIVETL